ncbi:MAG: hypothetical protein J2P41_12445 [Blastocatellia bacterium]|nr:hypothetical protein [Blastocatellia bacterium]
MPETDAGILKDLKSKIAKLAKLVADEAAANSEFRHKLQSVFMDKPTPISAAKVSKPTKAKVSAAKASKPTKAKVSAAKAPRPTKAKENFNSVVFLQENGRDKLQDELSLKTETELKLILRNEGIRKPKELKSIEKEQMIDEIIHDAERRLKAGTSFL